MRKSGLNGAIQPLWIDLLHELEALHRSSFDRRPPYCSGVIDDNIEPTIFLVRVSTYLDRQKQFERTLTVSSTILVTLSKSRTSADIACASPPASRISLSTVLMVDCCESGFGGNGFTEYASEVLFAETTTVKSETGV